MANDSQKERALLRETKTVRCRAFVCLAVRAFQIDTDTLSIQGVTGGMCETSGECSLVQTIPI